MDRPVRPISESVELSIAETADIEKREQIPLLLSFSQLTKKRWREVPLSLKYLQKKNAPYVAILIS